MVGTTQHEGGSEVTQESAGQIKPMIMMMMMRRDGVDDEGEVTED